MKRWTMAMVGALVLVSLSTSASAQTIAANTPLYVTLDQSVSSKTAKLGQIVNGTLAQSIVVDGNTVIPKGARVHLAVASVQASGRLSTPAKLYLRVDSVVVHRNPVSTKTNLWGQTEKSKAKRDAVGIGGGAAAGALIGAVAGGGKGAAIGTAAGAGVGTAGTAATGKKDVVFPAETKIKFTTRSALIIQ